MKKEDKKSKNCMKTIKILTIVLLIVLVIMVGFIGIYKQEGNYMENIVKDFKYGMDINGGRTVTLVLSSDNSDDVKTEDNYKTSKEIIEKRLKKLGVDEYKVSLNNQTGEILLQIPENSDTDTVVSNLTNTGSFELSDSETKEVLLDNSQIKDAKVLYNTTTTGTGVYLEIDFNNEGKKKLKDISKTYVETNTENTTNTENSANEANTESNETVENTENATNTENTENTNTENTTSDSSTKKQVTMKIDDEEIMTTGFDEAITDGKIQLSVGQASTDSKMVKSRASQAQAVVTELAGGKLPVKYEVEKNQYIMASVTHKNLETAGIVVAIAMVIGIVYLIIKYKVAGLLEGISFVGMSALYILLLRYTNVVISLESVLAIVITLILGYAFILLFEKNIVEAKKENAEDVIKKATSKTYAKFIDKILPYCIMSVAFCFAKWAPINTFGMASFWGIVIVLVCGFVTRSLVKVLKEDK